VSVPGSPARAGIDPSVGSANGPSSGLPRTRGDRPARDGVGAAERRAPPHARGSTQIQHPHRRLLSGSPARAGIDPLGAPEEWPLRRLPRTRGDRPRGKSRRYDTAVAPPHARGSTLSRFEAARDPAGSPARAGIDPVTEGVPVELARLPRTRGDRPGSHPVRGYQIRAPPHARGSTLSRSRIVLGWVGSPARAGIDPCSRRRPRTRVRLPRTRGDRPYIDGAPPCRCPAPPHARGSTLAVGRGNGRASGSPARAGIDPHPRSAGDLPGGLPRTRGDRPLAAVISRFRTAAPPHARGSTRDLSARGCDLAGSPARAGIDPTSSPLRAGFAWLPRTRGDRPCRGRGSSSAGSAPPHARGSTRRRAALPEAARGSPARAGIDPCSTRRDWIGTGLPRTRGDRPCPSFCWATSSVAPPHARGSTPAKVSTPPDTVGSPARAGIDPLATAFPTLFARLPRTRGDRPSVRPAG